MSLSDQDIQRIADAMTPAVIDGIFERGDSEIKKAVGKGVLGLFWKAVIGTLIFIAAYGAYKGQ